VKDFQDLAVTDAGEGAFALTTLAVIVARWLQKRKAAPMKLLPLPSAKAVAD